MLYPNQRNYQPTKPTTIMFLVTKKKLLTNSTHHCDWSSGYPIPGYNKMSGASYHPRQNKRIKTRKKVLIPSFRSGGSKQHPSGPLNSPFKSSHHASSTPSYQPRDYWYQRGEDGGPGGSPPSGGDNDSTASTLPFNFYYHPSPPFELLLLLMVEMTMVHQVEEHLNLTTMVQ